jgi:hypothetical protein
VLIELRYESFRRNGPRRDEQVFAGFSKWAWSKAGKWRWYSWKITYGGQTGDSLWAYDGRFKWEFSSPGGDPPKSPRSVKVDSFIPPRDYSEFSWIRAPYFCIAFHAGDGGQGFQWLDEHIDAGNVRLAGTETVGGRKLPVLELSVPYFDLDNDGNRVLAHGQPHRLTVDPEHGYLVSRNEHSGEIHVTEEFQRVAVTGSPDVWFPAKGRYEAWHKGKLQNRMRWKVQSVKLNEQLDDALFQPKIPPGTEIKDQTRGNVFTPKRPPAEPSVQDRIQLWLAWLVGAAVAAACGWMIVRTWKHLRRSIDN